MAVPISSVVNVVVAMPPIYPAGTGFSTLLVLGTSQSLPLSIRARQYFSMQSVSQDFPSSSEEYRAALSFFSQNPRPGFIAIGRCVTGPTGGELLGSGNFEPDMSVWRRMNPATEQLNLMVDNTSTMYTGIDFSQAVNLNGVAAAIQTAMFQPNRGTGHLQLEMNATTTVLTLQQPSTAANGDSIRIGSEYMTVQDASNPSQLTVIRGVRPGFPAAIHPVGSVVFIGVSGLAQPTITFTGSQFFIQSGTAGALSGITVGVPATNLSRMLGLDDGRPTAGIASAETVTNALDACEAALTFYGVVLTKGVGGFTDVQALEAASWVEGHTKLFGHATGDQNAKVASSVNDFPATCEGMALGRTMTAYNDPPGLSDYLMVSAFARELAVDFSQPNSTIVMMFRQCPGVTPSNINLNDKQVLDAKNCNYYTTFGTYPMFATGVMANGTWIDQRHGLDYLAQHLADAMFGGIIVVNKIPQTDKGMAYLTGLLDVAMQDMVNCGLIAPGTWKGTGIANVVNTGEYLPTGYKIYAAPIASQSEIDRMARKAPPVTIVCKGAGAIQHVDCFVQFEP